jgi:hypothetical protein
MDLSKISHYFKPQLVIGYLLIEQKNERECEMQ